MIKTFTDLWGEKYNLKGYDLVLHDNGTVTIQQGTFVLNRFEEEYLGEFKLSLEQLKELYREGMITL